jgi:signal transduction histidine kinase
MPLLDIVAIGLMRLAQPQLGLGLLWVFPILWVSTLVGVAGITASLLLVGSLVAIDVVVRHVPLTLAAMPAMIFLPVVLIFIGASGYLTARRDRAQRVLLGKQAEMLEGALAQARRQEALLAEVLNTVDFGVIRIDRAGQTTIVNEAQARLQYALGLSDVRAPVPATVSVVAADRVTPIAPGDAPLQRAMRGEEFEPVTVWVDAGTGDRVALSVTARRLENGDGDYDGSVVVSRDVTAEVAAVLARDDLIASVSHELRTPLTSILGYLELIGEGGGLPPLASSQLQIVHKNANRLLDLVADILASSRDAAQPMVLRLEPCALLDVVAQSVESLLPRAAERGIRIDATAAEPTALVADASRLRQLVDNLLANAIKYNVEGGEVSIGLASVARTVGESVGDGGIGRAVVAKTTR